MAPRRALAALLVVAGCGGAAPRVRLPAGSQVVARGSLAYAVAFADDGRIVSIELEERFALIVRSPDGRLDHRVDLGPAERDLPALAVAGDVAWVGGADRRVRAIALRGGTQRASWPTGAAVTALAAVGGGAGAGLAIADADGAVCLRRLADGALLQCVQLAERAIDELTAGDGLVIAAAGGRRWALAVPSLAVVPAPATRPPTVRRTGREVYIDGALAARLAGLVRAVAISPRGRIAVAAWIARLDDPSVVILPARPPLRRPR